jgi:hypothetical protein
MYIMCSKKSCKKKCCFCLCVPFVANPTYNCDNVFANPIAQPRTCCKCCKVKKCKVTSTIPPNCVSVYPKH